jgi:hypothetical protein
MISAQLEAPKGDGATIMVTTLVNFSRSLGGAIGANLCTTIFNSSVKNKMKAICNNSPELLQGVTQSDLSAVDSTPEIIYTFPEGPRNVILNAVMESIRNVFYIMTAAACLTFVITLFFSNKRIPRDEEIAKKEDYEKVKKTEE